NVRDCATIAKNIAIELVDKIGGDAIERNTDPNRSLTLGEIGNVLPGETITVPVNITCNMNFESAAFIVEWKNADIISAKAMGANGASCASSNGDGYCTVVVYGSAAIADGTVATIDFTIPEDMKFGSYPIYISQIDTFGEFCSEDWADTVSVAGTTINVMPEVPETIEAMEGDLVKLADDLYEYFTITSADKSIAKVVKNYIYGISVGVTEIIFTDEDGNTYTSKVIVNPSDSYSIEVGEQKLIYIPENTATLRWISEDNSVATVSDGVVSGVSAGTTEIYAIGDSNKIVYSGTITVTGESVTTDIPAVTTTTETSVSVSETMVVVETTKAPTADYVDEDMPTYALYLAHLEAKPGDIVEMPVNVKCNNNLNSFEAIINWDDTDLVSGKAIGANGNSTASNIGDGFCTVVAYNSACPISDGVQAYFEFTIPEDAEIGTVYELSFSTAYVYDNDNAVSTSEIPAYGGSITVVGDTTPTETLIELTEGESILLTGEGIENYKIISDNTSIATVKNNILTGVAGGNTKLYFIDADNNYTEMTVRVTPKQDIEINVGEEKTLFVMGESDNIKLVSNNTLVATVEDGVIKGVSAGATSVLAIDETTGKIFYTGNIVVNGEAVTTTAPTETTSVTESSVTTTETTVSTSESGTETSVSTSESGAETSVSESTTTTGSTVAVPGDANGDNELTVRDCAAIARALATGKVADLPLSADFNGDGEITVRDAAAIARVLAEAAKS
ncbi:MAG: hypothetical protein IJA12_01335, partial [Oscillospiraceae bacterium]|nr:hypothetical protein [Oscillospiraceae bacterium]